MKQLLPAIMFVGLLAPGLAQGSFNGVIPRIYYNSNSQVEELQWDRIANAWHASAIGQAAGAPPSAGSSLAGFAVGATLDPRVYYATPNAHFGRYEIVELALNRTTNTWSAQDLWSSQSYGVSSANPGLVGFATGINLDPRVYYVNVNNHAVELAWYGNQWHSHDISQDVGVQFNSCPAAFGAGANLDARVYCVDSGNHVRELAWLSSAWHVLDISQQLNAPALSGVPVGFGVGPNLDPRVYYQAANHHIQEMAWFSNTWHLSDLSQLLSAPADAGTERLVGFAAGTGVDPRVYYVDTQRRIEELAWFNTDQSWHLHAASSTSEVPASSFGAGVAVGTGRDPRVYYFGPNRQVREAVGDSRDAVGWAGRHVGEEANAAPEDLGTRIVAIGVGGPVVRLDVNTSVQSAVDQNLPGTTFIVSAGEHRMQQVVPKDGDVFIGERDSTGKLLSSLNGSMLLTGWTQQGNLWVKQVTMKAGYQYGDAFCTSVGVCQYPEVLFKNDQFLQRVRNLSQIGGSGQYYVQYDCTVDAKTGYCSVQNAKIGNQKIYVRLSSNENPNCYVTAGVPACPKLEFAVTPFAFGVDLEQILPAALRDSHPAAAGVTVNNLIVEKYATPGQFGAIGNHYPGLDWQVTGNEVRLNHGTGIKFHGQNAVVSGNYMHHNGQQGIAGAGTNASNVVEPGGIVQNNEIAFNNLPQVGFSSGWEAGGGKFVLSDGLVVRDNYIHDNSGPGLWNDGSTINTRFFGNRFIHNLNGAAEGDGYGLYYTISFATEIRDNTFENNEGPAVRVDNSKDVNIHNNSITVGSSATAGGIVIHELSGCFRLGWGCSSSTQATFKDASGNNHGYADDFQWCTSNNQIHDNRVIFTVAGLPGQMGAFRENIQTVRNCIKDPRLINSVSLPSSGTVDSALPALSLWHRVSFAGDAYYDANSAAEPRWAWFEVDANSFCRFQQPGGQEQTGKLYVGAQSVLAQCQAAPVTFPVLIGLVNQWMTNSAVAPRALAALQTAQADFAKNDIGGGNGSLATFIGIVSYQSGSSLTESQAGTLIVDANSLRR